MIRRASCRLSAMRRPTVKRHGPLRVNGSTPLAGPCHPGVLVADLDIGPAGQSGAVAGLCAEFGDACVLTPEKLPFYTKSSILWLAPTCDILPKTPFKPFRGGVSRVAVQAVTGARKL